MRNSTTITPINKVISTKWQSLLQNRIHRIILPMLVLMLGAKISSGQIAAWDFTGIGSTTIASTPATTFNANLVSTSGANTITRGAGAAWSTAANSWRTVGFKNDGIAVANTDYYQITLNASTGFTLSLSTIDARFAGTASYTVSPGVSSQFAYSLNGTTFTLIGSPSVNIGTPATLTQINLSGITALQNVAAGTTVTIRYFATGQTATGGWGFNSPSSGTNGLAIGGTLTAVPLNYTVTYNGNGNTGGTAPVDGSSPYTAGSNVTVLGAGTLVRTGYTFAGWNTLANGTGTAYSAGGTINSISANTTLFAQWSVNTYAVTYNGNGNDGGSAPVDPSSPYNYNSNVTILGQGTLTKTGFAFNGWNTAANGSGTSYIAGNTITGIAAAVTLFAQWVPANTYAVTYLGNTNTGGTAPVDPNSPYAGGSNVTVLGQGTLTKTGYTFSGWNTAADGSGTAFSAGGTISNISASTTLFAQWTINTYTVTYNGNTNDGGTAPVDPNSPYNFNSNVTVLGVGSLTKTNYSFTGWNTVANGSGTAYAAGSTITGIAANTTLFAQWTVNTFTVTYNGNTNTGGTAPVDPSSPYAATSNVTVLGVGTLIKTGYTFTGWNTVANGTGTAYSSGGTISNILANTVLFAQWSINSYTVTYDGNGNTGGTAPVDPSSPYVFGTVVTVLTNSGGLTLTNATFVGWNTAANGTGTTYAPGATFTLGAANVLLYAKWAVPLYESFSYTAGGNVGGNTAAAGTTNNNWTTHSNSLVGTINVVAGSLNYTGLQASTGNRISVPGSNGTVSRDINRPAGLLASQNTTYYSFLLNVTDATQLATAFGTGGNSYFIHLSSTSGTAAANFTGKVHIRSSNTAANFRLGISEISNTPVEATGDLNFGTTYLVVVKYVYNNTAGNDLATLWVNPASLGGSEPAGGINGAGSVNVAAYNSINTGICIRDASGTPKADIDEIRVGTTWASVTPANSSIITATAQTAGGSISPSGAVTVSSGGTQAFTITTASCNDIADVIVDGTTSVLGDLVGNTYTFTNVTANHTIDVYFNPSTSTTWTGNVNNDWDNAGNWTSCVPNGTLDVTIPGTASLLPILNVDADVNSLSITGSASLVLNGKTLTINGGYSADASASLIGSDASNIVLNSTTTLFSGGASPTIRLHNLTVNGGTTTLASAVEISGGTATVLPGTLTVPTGSQLQSNGFLTIKSNAFGTGRVAAGDDAGNYITGDVTVERYIPANSFRSWRLLSVPTTGGLQTIRQAWQEGDANPSPLQNNIPGFGTQITGTGVLATAQANGFDNVAASAALLSWTGSAWAGVANTNTNISALAGKKGLFLYIRGERSQGVTNSSSSPTATTLRTKGQLYQGTQAIPSFTANTFNLVGNLYASAINFTQLNRTGGVSNLFYIWDSKKLNGTSLGTYQTFSATNSFNCLISGGSYTLGQPNTKIESGQAFFVQTSATAGTITLNEGSKITNGANLGFRPVTPANLLVKLDTRLYSANSTEIVDANVVVFDNKYSNDVAEEDAIKLANTTENFGVQKGDKVIAIEGRKPVSNTDNISFSMSNLKQQEYVLEFAPQNMTAQGLIATLEDSYLKTSTAISMDAASTVTFTVDANAASKAANRFTVVFKKAAALPVSEVKPAFVISPNPVNGEVVRVQFNNQPQGNYSIRLIGNNGQALFSTKLVHAGGSAAQVVNLPVKLTAGVYQLEIISANKTTTTQSLLVK